MPYCPVCKHKFSSDVDKCPEDQVELVDQLPYQTIEGETTAWVEIASVGSEDEARLLQGFLEAEGIPTQVESVKFNMEPINFGTMGEVRIYVDAEREEEAMGLLREREEQYGSLTRDESVMTDEGPAEIDDNSVTATEESET